MGDELKIVELKIILVDDEIDVDDLK